MAIFIKREKTNWKYILIVFILGLIVGAGSLWYTTKQEFPSQLPKIEKAEEAVEEQCENVQDLGKRAECYTDLAKETKDESYCAKTEIPELPEVKANCYTELAFLKNDPSICEKIETASLKSSCSHCLGKNELIELWGENNSYAVYLIKGTEEILVYDKTKIELTKIEGEFAVAELLPTQTTPFPLIVINDEKGEYIVLSVGTYTSRGAVVISLVTKNQVVEDFCYTPTLKFWKNFIIYADCYAPEESHSGIAAVDLKTEEVQTIFEASLLKRYYIEEIKDSTLTVKEVESQKTRILTYNLEELYLYE